MLSCNFTRPQHFDPPMVLRKLYGPYFDSTLSGRGSLLILGQHNSGTSMLARLLMLMGAFQGNVHGAFLCGFWVDNFVNFNYRVCDLST